MTRRLLILGGTGEAVALAQGLAGRPDLEVVTSFAGRTRAPTQVPGKMRSGGFGGIDGLRAYLEAERIEIMVDATHPFAGQMHRNVAVAAHASNLPLLRIERPA